MFLVWALGKPVEPLVVVHLVVSATPALLAADLTW